MIRYLFSLVDEVTRAGRIGGVEILDKILQLRVVLRLRDRLVIITLRALHLLLVCFPHAVVRFAIRIGPRDHRVTLTACIDVLEHGELSRTARGRVPTAMLSVHVLLHDGRVSTLCELATFLNATVAEYALSHHLSLVDWLGSARHLEFFERRLSELLLDLLLEIHKFQLYLLVDVATTF